MTLPPSEILQTRAPTTHLMAAVAECVLIRKNRLNMKHTKGEFKALRVVDVGKIQCVVGRVRDRGEDTFIERLDCDAVLEARDDPEEATIPRNHRLRASQSV